MILPEQTTSFPRETRSLVSQISMSLFNSLDKISPNNQLSIESLKIANQHGVTPQLIEWHSNSHLSQQDLIQTIQQNVSGDDKKQMMRLITGGDEYWNTYGLDDTPTINNRINHLKSYKCANDVYLGTTVQPDYYMVYQALTIAATYCLMTQTKDAFTCFMDKSTIESRINSVFTGDQSSKLLSIINTGESTHACESQLNLVESIRGDGVGDAPTGTPIDTFSEGSARKPRDNTIHIKTISPYVQHLLHTSTLSNVLITTDQTESCGDSLDHVRLGSIYDQAMTSSDCVDKLTQFYTQHVVSTDDVVDSDDDINKKRNDYMQSQLPENMLLTKDGDNRANVDDTDVQ